MIDYSYHKGHGKSTGLGVVRFNTLVDGVAGSSLHEILQPHRG